VVTAFKQFIVWKESQVSHCLVECSRSTPTHTFFTCDSSQKLKCVSFEMERHWTGTVTAALNSEVPGSQSVSPVRQRLTVNGGMQ